MFQIPPSGRIRYFQINTMEPPQTIPASAPHLLVRFQNRENRTTGPNAAPNPAQAKETMANTELSGFLAMNAATTEITRSVIHRECRKKPQKMQPAAASPKWTWWKLKCRRESHPQAGQISHRAGRAGRKFLR